MRTRRSSGCGGAVGWTALAAVMVAAVLPARASFSLGLDEEFSGGTPPASATTPWVLAQFEDYGVGQVRLTLSNPHLGGTENVAGFYFNFNSALSPAGLSFARETLPPQFNAFTAPSIDTGVDAYKADGDGRYDVKLSFATGGNVAQTFGAGDALVYLISYTSAISAADFQFLSSPEDESNPSKGPFYAAAHVQNTPGGNSGWISAGQLSPIPEPSTWVAGLALLGVAVAGWARRIRA